MPKIKKVSEDFDQLESPERYLICDCGQILRTMERVAEHLDHFKPQWVEGRPPPRPGVYLVLLEAPWGPAVQLAFWDREEWRGVDLVELEDGFHYETDRGAARRPVVEWRELDLEELK